MSDAKPNGEATPGSVRVARRDHELRARFEHARALNSAWTVLAPFEISAEARHIVETGRAVGAELRRLASHPPEHRDPTALPKLDKLLDATARELLALAFQVPVAQLRATLPARLAGERRGVLDLLDLMLLAEIENHEGAAGRISALDYLISLLCTGGDEGEGEVVEDPVGLTPRLHALCEQASEEEDPELAEIEAAFQAAAAVDEEHRRDEARLRELRRRKRQLGRSFFVPRVLRAVVAYNASLSRCIRRGGFDSRDWGSLTDGSAPPASDTSVFESQALPRLAEALRRRASGSAPNADAIDRVAWCLDMASLNEVGRAALLAPSAGMPGDLEGTAMLVGLISRSGVVLEEELPGIGILPEKLASDWIAEIDEAFKQAVNAGVTGDAYEEARRISAVRSSFRALMTDAQREQRRMGRTGGPERFENVEREAKQLAGEALVKGTAPRPVVRDDWKSPRSSPKAWIAGIGGGIAALAFGALVFAQLYVGGDFDRLSGDDLEAVSPYLAKGKRNGEGLGRAFVGTIDDDWVELATDDRETAAEELVNALRGQGVREIMIYDDAQRLRIQAMGEQPPRVLPAPSP